MARSLENNALKTKSRQIYTNFHDTAQNSFCLWQIFSIIIAENFIQKRKFSTKLLRRFEDTEVFVEGSLFSRTLYLHQCFDIVCRATVTTFN